MNDVKKLGKKMFTVSVVVLTIMWSMGVAAFLPSVVLAVDCPTLEAGDLFKVADNTAVYLLNADMERMYFPNSELYHTWYGDFSGVQTIPNTCVDAYPAPSKAPYGVNYRAGSRLVKVTISPSVYVVSPNNSKSKVASEAVAKDLYGSNWAKLVRDVADVYWPNYVATGSELATAVPHDGMLVKKSGETKVYLVSGGKLYEVDGTLGAAAKNDVRTVSTAVFGALEVAGTTKTAATVVENPAQTTASGTGTGTGTGTGVTGGDLSVSLAADTPASAYVYKNSTSNPFTKIKLTAGSKDVTVTSFVVQRAGAPASDLAFTGINVLKDGALLSSNYKTLNSDHQVTFTEDVKVPANTSVYLTLVGKMANLTTYGNEVPKLALASMVTDGTVTASFPIEGNAMTINTTVTVGVVTVTENPDLGTLTEEVGTTDVEFLNVKIANDSANNIDEQVESIRFNNAGSGDDGDLSNLELLADGDIIATSVMVDNYINFDVSSLASAKILNGKYKTFTLRGDITGGSGRTFDFDIKKVDDIRVKDLLNNSYPTPSAAIDSGRTITISRGTLNVSKTNTVQAGNIPENTTDLELASWNFKVTGESITVASLSFAINVNGTVQPADFTQMKLVDSKGNALTGTFDGVGSTAADGSVTTTDSFTLPEGDNLIKLIGKLNADSAVGDWVEFGVDLSYEAGLDAKGDVTGDAITIETTTAYATPNAIVYANRRTIAAGALSVTTLASPAGATVAAGTAQQQFSTIDLDATASSEDVKITAFSINLITATGEANQIQNITFKVNDKNATYRTLSTVKNGSLSTASLDELITVTLPSADYIIIKKGTKVTMKIYADISASASALDTFRINLNNVANDNSSGTATVTAAGVLTGADITEVYSASVAGLMTVGAAGGHLEVALASDNPNASLMAADTNVTLGAYRFLATSTEDVELDYLYVTQIDTTAATSSYTDYDYIWFEDAVGNEIAGTRMSPTNTNPYIDFADDAFIVEADGSAEVLYLKGNIAPIGSCASLTCTGANGTPGHKLGYKITTVSTDVVAVGHGTGSGTTEFAGTVVPTGNTHYVYKAYPVVAKKSVSTSLANGTRDLFKFQVSAVNGDIALGGFTFDISTTTASVVANSCYLYDVTTSDEKQINDTAGCRVLVTDNAAYVNKTSSTNYATGIITKFVGHGDDWDTTQSNDQITVSVNVPRTFVLRGNITGSASGASVSTGLAGDASVIIGGGITGGGAKNMVAATAIERMADRADFIWSDINDNGHNDATTDWTNGYLVSGLSSSTSTLETVAYGS